jgi:hypothetical protein
MNTEPISRTSFPKPIELSKREYFAGLAMRGILSNHELINIFNCESQIAENSIKFADELINQLNQTKP